MRNGSRGELPPDGEAVVAGIRLPAGKRAGTGPGITGHALWVTGEFGEAASAWLSLCDRLTGTGLIPLLLSGLPEQPGRPWDTAELNPDDPIRLDSMDADPAEVLRGLWDSHISSPEEDEAETAALVAPFTRSFPGLAPATGSAALPGELDDAVLSLPGPLRVGLVPASRPADALVRLGWGGAQNYHKTPVPLALVLRSWEERFGARLMHLGFDTMELLVQRPVPGRQAALAVAAEHFAFCMDNVYQGAGSIQEYAADLTGAPIWSFWWD